nr:flagellar filament capping protein FliD [uncultured Agathobacter sp.]
MAIRLSGMTSGLDTDSIVKAMVSSYTTRKEKYQKAQTKLEWTQDAWKSLNTKVYSLYSNISNLRFSTAYNLKKTSVSDTTKATVKAGSGAPSGTQSLKIKQMAKAGYMTGAEIKADSEKTTLAQLGYTGGDAKLEVKMGDETKSITLSASSTMNDVVKELRNAGLDANYDSSYKRFYISSKKTGVANDFTITGSNIDGASALYSLGIAYGGEKTTTGTYSSNPYDEYADLHGASDDETRAKIEAAVTNYNNLTTDAAKMNAQSKNLMNAVNYGYSYATLQGIYEKLNAGDSDKLKLLEKLGSSRDGAVISKNGNSYDTYTKTTLTDTAGHTLYKYIDSNNNSHYIAAVNDTDKNTTSYYDVTESPRTVYTDADGKELEAAHIDHSDDMTTLTVGGKTYKKDETDGKYYTADKTDSITVSQKTEYTIAADAVNKTGIESASVAYDTIIKSMDEKTKSSYDEALASVQAFENSKDEVLGSDDKYSVASLTKAIQNAYAGNGKEAVEQLLAGNGNETDGFVNKANALEEAAEANTKKAADSNIVKELASKQKDSSEYTQALNDLLDRVNTAYTLQNKALFNSQVKKVAGQDSEIELNGVKYTGDSNSYSINGLTIEALAETGDRAISITTSTDTQGVYDKVKDFLTEYNNIINEMTKLYNADSAGSYEPLTDDEKDQMSDKEIEKWETKIKDSLLRRDSTLGSVMTAMQTAMMSSVEIGGKKYSLSSFGISTLGFLNAAENEQNAYHIDGDEDDANTSGKTDKLMAAINDDPDTVMQFMQQLSTNLYSAIGDKMKSTDLSSAFTIYNDKQMKTEYTNYTKTIKEWEKKIADREDYYYNKFTQMESAMTKLNSTQSSISSYFS